MNVIAIGAQGCSGALVEYLLPNLKVVGSRPPMLKYFSVTPPENSGGAEKKKKIQQKIQTHIPKTFFALCTNLVYDIRSGYRKLTSSLVTVYEGETKMPLSYSGKS
jgi:hypothetical protein